MGGIRDIRRMAGEPQELSEEKIRKVVEFENWMAAFDSLILCKFGRDIYNMDLMIKMFNAVTGLGVSKNEFVESLNRIVLLTRLFNQREGIIKDTLPSRYFNEPIRINGREHRLTKEQFESALRTYYSYRGLSENGEVPSNMWRELEAEKMLR